MNQSNERQPTYVRHVYALLLLLFFLVVYILPLGARDLFLPDETRYAEIPREMIAEGDWVIPHLNGLRYFEKPVLGYWATAGSILLFGENNFAVRFPSALAVGLSGLLIYILVGRVCHKEAEENGIPAILAVLAFLTCFGVFGVGNIAVLDSLFSFFLTATIIAFYFASEAPPRSSKESRLLLLAGLSCGLAFLTKGFLAFAVPVLAFAPYLVWQGRWKDVSRMSWLPILMAVLVALPWSILIHLREPDFWRVFFWNEHIGRLIPDTTEHNESFWFYLKAAPGLFMPWAFLTPTVAAGIRGQLKNRGSQDRLIRLSICWLMLPFLFFSIASSKLLTYILPCFPPFAVLMTLGLLNDLRKEGRNHLFQWGVIVTGVLFGLVLLALIYVQLFGYKGFRPYGRPWKAMMAINAFDLIILFSFLSFKSRERTTKIVLLGFSPFLFFLTINFILPDITIEKKAPGILLERYSQDIGHDSIIIADENTATAVCWYLHRSDVYMLGDGGELNYGLAYKDASGRHLDIKSALDLIDRNQGNISLIARVRNISRWRDQLPKPFFQNDSGLEGYVLWRY